MLCTNEYCENHYSHGKDQRAPQGLTWFACLACHARLCHDCIDHRVDPSEPDRDVPVCRYCGTNLHVGARCLDEADPETAPRGGGRETCRPPRPLAEALRQRLATGTAPESSWGLCQACGQLAFVTTTADLNRTSCHRCGAICWAVEGGQQVLGPGIAGPPTALALAAEREALFESLREKARASTQERRGLEVDSWYWANRFPVAFLRISDLLVERGERDLAELLAAAMRRANGS